jgi:hypothetical protein
MKSILLLIAMLLAAAPAFATKGDGVIEPGEDATAEMARAVQNPVANLISVPFQNNTFFDFGPREGTLNVLNIQPVWPFTIGEKWNLITRTIFPVISQPGLIEGQDRETGLGDIVFTGFLSPRDSGKWIWGVGPVVQFPTATDSRLGAQEWGLGASAVALTMPGNWVIGALVNNVWGISEDEGNEINQFLLQYFINYNLNDGWYLISAPIIQANWEAPDDQTWVVPFGGGAGKIFLVGKQPVNLSLQGYYNVEKPDALGDWSTRINLQFMFPK